MSETEEETQELVEEVKEPSDEVETPSDEVEAPPETPEQPEAVEAVVEKADETVAAVTQATPAYIDNLPYGGAVTMGDAEKYMEAKNEAIYVMDMWSVFSNVAWNILERSDIGNKKDAMVNAIDGFKNILTAKAMVAFSKVEEEPHPLQPRIDELLEAIDGSVNKSEAERAEVLNPMLQNLAPAITDYLSQKSDVEQPVPEDDNKDNLLQEITNLIQPIADKLGILSEEVNTMKSQATAQGVQPKERIPRPRTITGLEVSNLTAKSETANKSTTPKLRDIINKSIGQ
jgi:hypothetical protein